MFRFTRSLNTNPNKMKKQQPS